MKTKTLLNHVDGRLAAYATLAGAALAAPVLIQDANATIIYSGVVNFNVPSTTSGIYLNIVTGVTSTTPAGAPGWDLNPWSTASLEIWGNNSASPNDGVLDNFTGGTAASVDNLPLGTLIDGSWNYGRTDSTVETSGPTAFLLNSSNNIFGFRFLNESTGMLNFGWARISLAVVFGWSATGNRRVWLRGHGRGDYGRRSSGAKLFCATRCDGGTGALGVREWRKRKAA